MYQQPYSAPGYYGSPAPPPSQNGYGSYGSAGPSYQQPQHQHQHTSYAQAGPSTYAAGAPSYGGYVGPPPQQQYYQQQEQPPPPPVQQAQLSQAPYNLENDPNVFRGYFSHELRSLTFNSKPIINGLTILAGDHAPRMAPIVAQCLEDHIRQVRLSTRSHADEASRPETSARVKRFVMQASTRKEEPIFACFCPSTCQTSKGMGLSIISTHSALRPNLLPHHSLFYRRIEGLAHL